MWRDVRLAVGKTAEEQEEQANKIMADRRKMGLEALERFESRYSDEERVHMTKSYNDELDENFGLNGYEFAIVMQVGGGAAHCRCSSIPRTWDRLT